MRTAVFIINFICGISIASTFYVDVDSIGGSCLDSTSNSGSINQPWCSISYGVAKLSPGDILYVRHGVYNESFLINISGNENNRIIVSGYPGERPVIDGLYSIPNHGSCNTNEDCPENNVCDKNTHVCGNGNCDPVSGNCFIYNGLIKISGEFISVENFEVTRSFGRGIQVEQEGGNTEIKNCISHHNRNSGILIYRAKPQHLIENCKVYNSGNFATYSRGASVLDWPGGIAWRATEDVTVKGCEVFNNWGEGIIPMESEKVKIINNIVYDNYAVEIYGATVSDGLVEGNLVFNSGDETYFRGGYPCAGIYFTDEPSACTKDDLWTNNIKIINNLIAGNGTNLYLAGGCKTGQTVNTFIGNNTSINPAGKSIIITSNYGSTAVARVINNLFYDVDTIDVSIVNVSTIEFANNLWSFAPVLPGNVKVSQNFIFNNPGLNDLNKILSINAGEKMSAYWFKLSSGSPARNKALKVEEVASDFYGNMRDDTPDIGAVEYMQNSLAAPQNFRLQ